MEATATEKTEDTPEETPETRIARFKGIRATPEQISAGQKARQARVAQAMALLRQQEEAIRIREIIEPNPDDERVAELASRNIMLLDARVVEPTHQRLASMVWGVATGSWMPDKSQMEGLKLMARLYAADASLEAARDGSGSIRELASSIRAMLGRK